MVWSFHDRIYTFCKSVLFSNIECLIFEFFRFLNWRKALKVFLYMNITCKAVKICIFSAKKKDAMVTPTYLKHSGKLLHLG